MKHVYLALLSVLCCANLKAQTIFNGSFEQIDRKGNPQGWNLNYYQTNKYDIKLDSVIRKRGKYSVSLSSNDKTGDATIVYTIPKTFSGSNITLTGYLRTENVTDGFAGIWLRVSGSRGKELAFEAMKSQNLSGTNDWKEYMISLPYNEQESVSIELGALLIGKGKVWVDDLKLYIDEKPIHEVALSKMGGYKALKDTVYDKSSGLADIPADPASTKRLTAVGQLWGFLKYHHPAIAKGDHNWDADLFRKLPAILQSKSDLQVSGLLEKWVDELGPVVKCDTCNTNFNKKDVAQASEYGNLFVQPVFTQSLRAKLKYIHLYDIKR